MTLSTSMILPYAAMRTKILSVSPVDLGFRSVQARSSFPTVSVGDINGDDKNEFPGVLQNAEGTFSAPDLFASGLPHYQRAAVDSAMCGWLI
jgi:hypothetical protein